MCVTDNASSEIYSHLLIVNITIKLCISVQHHMKMMLTGFVMIISYESGICYTL